MIKKATLHFLSALRRHNDRAWFEEHKHDYRAAQENVTAFAEALKTVLNETDVVVEHRVYRIYRDIRFSPDKTPYKDHWDGYFYRAGAERRGGYVFRIGTSGASQVGGGFFGPEKDDLLRIRRELEADRQSMDAITRDSMFVKHFGALRGEEVKTAPRGFDKDHPHIDWIRKKQFLALRPFSDEEVLRADFIEQVGEAYRALRPFFDYMSAVLTTNADGEVIV